MKELYDKVAAFEEKVHSLKLSPTGEYIDDVIIRKLYWSIASRILGTEISFGDLDGMVLNLNDISNDSERRTKLLPDRSNLAELGKNIVRENNFESYIEFMNSTDIDNFIDSLAGKYWKMITIASDTFLSQDEDILAFYDFFKSFENESSYIVTKENLSAWEECLIDMIITYFPGIDALVMKELICEYHQDTLFDEDENGDKVYREDNEFEILQNIVSMLRNEWKKTSTAEQLKKAEKIKACIISGLLDENTYGSIMKGLSNEALLQCYELLCSQPLMVKAWDDIHIIGIPCYALLEVESHNKLWNIPDYELEVMPEELSGEILQYCSTVTNHGVIFPFMHDNDLSEYSGEKYIVGSSMSCADFGGGYGMSFESILATPSLTDMVLLKWADNLYDAYLAYKGQESAVA